MTAAIGAERLAEIVVDGLDRSTDKKLFVRSFVGALLGGLLDRVGYDGCAACCAVDTELTDRGICRDAVKCRLREEVDAHGWRPMADENRPSKGGTIMAPPAKGRGLGEEKEAGRATTDPSNIHTPHGAPVPEPVPVGVIPLEPPICPHGHRSFCGRCEQRIDANVAAATARQLDLEALVEASQKLVGLELEGDIGIRGAAHAPWKDFVQAVEQCSPKETH